MDTTDIYLEMSKKAIKIQEDWKPAVGDFVVVDRKRQVGLAPANQCGFHIINEVNHKITMCPTTDTYQLIRDRFPWDKAHQIWKSHLTWLPRQDQLQKIIEFDVFELFDMFDHDFLESSYGGASVRCPKWIDKNWSMEQFWLALVMKNKYDMVWNSEKEDWVGVT